MVAQKHTRFGTLMEPVSQALFHEKFNCTSNQQLINQVNAHASERHPWMRSNVDDIVSIGGQNTDPNVNGVIVVDYKTKPKFQVNPQPRKSHRLLSIIMLLRNQGFRGQLEGHLRILTLLPRILKYVLLT